MAADLFAQRLADVEQLQSQLNDALGRSDAPAIAAHSGALRRAVQELAQAVAGADTAPADAAVRQRMAAVARTMAAQREQCARQTVFAERGLALLLPNASPTYDTPRAGARFRGGAPRLFAGLG